MSLQSFKPPVQDNQLRISIPKATPSLNEHVYSSVVNADIKMTHFPSGSGVNP